MKEGKMFRSKRWKHMNCSLTQHLNAAELSSRNITWGIFSHISTYLENFAHGFMNKSVFLSSWSLLARPFIAERHVSSRSTGFQVLLQVKKEFSRSELWWPATFNRALELQNTTSHSGSFKKTARGKCEKSELLYPKVFQSDDSKAQSCLPSWLLPHVT